ncbi:hypothetical protein KTD55_28130 [Burkholderia gladioli]|uniref:hypothetical protein n=1 Tax=Burkholderia gladioli TaxID=28095 RepID=UPI001C23814D|nr:hypothetical protein [Burkholderia gladioli]MBU9217939.1 hypothetical protein [Burkholderia gladioli]MDN7726967.1 hypothetical protein [Burkholderia gladioli]
MLSELGRRIERLMYFGGLLVVACALQVYMVATVNFIGTDNPAAFSVLADRIEESQSRLQDLFSASVAPPTLRPRDTSAEIAVTRKLLGLPPPELPPEPIAKDTYASSLDRLVLETAAKTGMRPTVLSGRLDTKKPPLDLVKSLRERQKELEKQPIVVWGIEAPITLPFQYGAAQYQVPNWVFANLLFIALLPLCIGWLGSIYFTRQREIFILRKVSDYKVAFPHILNILPIVPMSIDSVADARFVRMKYKYHSRVFNRIFFSLLRSILILVFALPMVFTIGYSALALLFERDSAGILVYILTPIIAVVLVSQVAMLIAQEWWLLWGKEFSA